jgi:hypothetical protein
VRFGDSVKYKTWNQEGAFTLLRALEYRLSPLGYHVAMPHRVKQGELMLVLYADERPVDDQPVEIGKKRDRESIVSLLQATEMRLLSIDELKNTKTFAGINLEFKRVETWSYGRGKNIRRVQVFMLA